MPDKSVTQFANLTTSAIETAAQAEDGYRLAYELESAGYPRAAQYLRVAEAAINEANERAIKRNYILDNSNRSAKLKA